jgi:hypothetical protein
VSSLGTGKVGPTVAVGNGSPRGGVLPWMSGDDYLVWGFFGEYTWNQLLVQAAYWQANHDADRNPSDVLTVVLNSGISPRQRGRFLGANAGKPDAALTTADVVPTVSYSVQSFYVRIGYTIESSIGSFTPYGFVDWMSHPEAIANKTYGGDAEAGFADDGKFWKPSVGVVYKPVDEVAIKLDTSAHIQKFNGATEVYPEVRLDVSWAFNLLGG